MKIILKPFILIISIVLAVTFLVNANHAMAVGAAYFNLDTTVPMTIGGSALNFTIVAESDADSIFFDTGSLAITISAGERVTITSSDRKDFSTNAGLNVVCTSSQSSIIVESSTPKTITVTPSASTCSTGSGSSSGSSSGGGGGGGGGGIQIIATPTPTPTTTPTPSVSVTPTPSVSVSPSPVVQSTSVVPGKLYRKIGDPKVYKQNSDGTLTWVKTLEEFNALGLKWSDVKQVSAQDFSKLTSPVQESSVVTKIKIVSGIGYLNVRNGPSLTNKVVGKVLSGETYVSTEMSNGWYKIQKDGKDLGWVSAKYAVKI